MMEKDKYFELIKQWMQYFGCSSLNPHPESGTDLVFHKSENQLSKFGKVDSYIFIKHFSAVDANTLVQYSTKMYGHASKHRAGMPLGFGAMLVVFPLIITDKISNEAYNAVMQYCPKHFAAAEFPSIFDLSTEYLYYYDKTPVWGMAYYDGYRRDTYKYFSPASWRELAVKSV